MHERNHSDPGAAAAPATAQTLSPIEATLRRNVGRLLRRSGLMPAVFQMRIAIAPFWPETLAKNFRWWRKGTRDSLPIPSSRGRFLVSGSSDIQGFLDLGRVAAGTVEAACSSAGRPIDSMRAVLDFGCGCGRVLRQWRHLSDRVAFHGAEMNEELVRECRRCVPFATIEHNSAAPPLDHPDQRFDLIYAFSVFTHLHEDLQRAWCSELARLLAPGGLVILSTHGEHYLPRLSESERAQFATGACVVQGAAFLGENLCVTYHPEAAVRALVADRFDVLQFAPSGALGSPGQDFWLLRKR